MDTDLNKEEKTSGLSRRENSMRFVTANYRRGAFDVRRDWNDLGLSHRSWLRRHAVAVALWGGVLVAVAALSTWMLLPSSAPTYPEEPASADSVSIPVAHENVNRRIEFSDVSLEEVAAAVRNVYGVELENIPTDGSRLTLSYEGPASGLVEAINSVLGCSITIVDDNSGDADDSKAMK